MNLSSALSLHQSLLEQNVIKLWNEGVQNYNKKLKLYKNPDKMDTLISYEPVGVLIQVKTKVTQIKLYGNMRDCGVYNECLLKIYK